MRLISLTYVSASSELYNKNELMDILEASRRNNPKYNITGMLLYRSGYFIQALEGEERDVDAIYEKIKQDPRHQNILVVQKEAIEERAFGEWSMGFQNLDDVDLNEIPGYSDFLDAQFSDAYFRDVPNRAKHLLNVFKSGNSW